MKAFLGLSVLLLTSMAMAANPCQKTESAENLDACFQSPALKWAFSPVQDLTTDKIRKGPSLKPGLSKAEIESGTIFCQYFHHVFSSPGSAKFLCARTTAEGVLLDNKGQPVPEARSVSTREMNLQVQLNGETKKVDEGVLLGESGQPVIRTKEDGKQSLVEADEIKVKYFVDQEHQQDASVQRGSYQLKFDQRTITLENTFVGPREITNPRWKEVFTEAAASRLFWALGLPADIMIPMNQVVCFGCTSHPTKQTQVDLSKTSVFNTVLLEKKFPGNKVGEQFNFNRVSGKFLPSWSEEIKHEFEAMVLGTQLIAYHHAISLQNRMQCAEGQYDKQANVCNVPVPFIQDIGSSFAGKSKQNGGRGNLADYKAGKVFSRRGQCVLYYELGSDRIKDTMEGPTVREVSGAGLEKFKARLAGLTPEVVRSIFEVARFGDIDPKLRDAAPGADLNEKRNDIIDQWTESLVKRIQEIQNARCN